MGKVRILVLTIIFSLAFLAGCGSEKVSTGPVDTYTIADTNSRDSGFPSPYAHGRVGPGYEKMSLLFDTLIWKDENGLIPALAEKWHFVARDNAYYFDLRKNVKWHDGKPFTARDVVFTFDYMKKHPYASTDFSNVDKVAAPHDYQVVIYLKEPYAPFEMICSVLPILPEHIWKKVKEPEKFLTKEATIGTGPFKFLDYNKERNSYFYEANTDYYQGVPRVKKLIFMRIASELAPTALRHREVNAIAAPPDLTEDLVNEGFTVMNTRHEWMYRLMINHQKEPLSTKEFRQAIAYAIDRHELVKIGMRTFADPGSPGIVTEDFEEFYNRKAPQYAYDPGKAGELLEGLGYRHNGKYYEKDGKVLEFGLLTWSGTGKSATSARIGELVKDQLEGLGIKINLVSMESRTVDELIDHNEFDLAITGHGGFSSDPEFLNRLITGKGQFSSKYQANSELNKVLKNQVLTVDREKRIELLKKAQMLIAEDVPTLPLVYFVETWAHDGKVQLFFNKKGTGTVNRPFNKIAFLR